MAGGTNDVITIVNELQDVFSRSRLPMDLQLPQIVVVGGQSAGKSSVLESFVQWDFLPRGSGIVTRCPVILQLRNSRDDEETAELLLQNGEKKVFTDLSDVKKALQDETDKIAGTNKGISKQAIRLKIFSPKVLDFTLVDLPGLTKVPVGDQPKDIDEQVEELVYSFANQENTLILAVSPANQDLANSDSLKVARQVDPDGDRTIGVITKLDLMDSGTDARDVLENQVYPLTAGYVGVVNRSQKEINENSTMQSTKKKEADFFRNHSSYSHMANTQGSEYLQKVLNKKLREHIEKRLPDLKVSLMKKCKDLRAELTDAGVFKVTDNKMVGMLQLVEDLKEKLKCTLEGQSADINEKQIEGGAKINKEMHTTIAEMLKEVTLPSKEEIVIIIANMHGYRNSLTMPELAFESVMKKLILQYKEPLNSAVRMISSLLKDIVEKQVTMLHLTPVLQQEVMLLMNKVIEKQEAATQEVLSLYLDAECSYMNTSHPNMTYVYQQKKNKKRKAKKSKAQQESGMVKENGDGETAQVIEMDKEKEIFNEQGSVIHYLNGKEVMKSNGLITLLQHEKTKEIRLLVQEKKYDPSTGSSCKVVVLDKELSSHIKLSENINKNCSVEFQELGFPQTIEEERYAFEFHRPATVVMFKSTLTNALETFRSKDEEKQTAHLIMMAHAYMKIVQNNVMDQTMKYITLLIVKETIRYFSVDLLAELLKGNPEEFMKFSDDIERKIGILKVYEEGIKIFDKSFISLKKTLT